MNIEKYNPTCIVTGKKDNLLMFAHRNSNGDMVGWLFVHESVDVKDIPELNWNASQPRVKDQLGAILLSFRSSHNLSFPERCQALREAGDEIMKLFKQPAVRKVTKEEIVKVLREASEKRNDLIRASKPFEDLFETLTTAILHLLEQGEGEKEEWEPCIIQSAFHFENGKRIIVYTGDQGIKSFECDEKWEPYGKPFAESSSFKGNPIDYHFKIREMHGEEKLVKEHSTPLTPKETN